MAGNLIPPFIPPDITDPLATDNAANGYEEFNDLKNYITSFLQIQFDLTTGLFLNTALFPASAIPQFFGDVTTPAPITGTTQLNTTVGKINGVTLSGLATGLLKNTTGTGQPSIATAGTDYLAPAAIGTTVKAYYAPGQEPATATNDNAAAGKVGEEVQSLIAIGSAVSLVTATGNNVTSISLTAGDWDVEGNVNFSSSGATVTASVAGISLTSITPPTDGSEGYSGVLSATAIESATLPRKRVSIASTTTVYLTAKATFTAGTVTSFGAITARRAR